MTTRVAIVDDEASVRNALVAALQQVAAVECVGTFADAAGALASLPARRPDLVLLDVVMPGMSGLELAQQLRSALPHLKLLLLTGLPWEDAAVAAHQAGADWVLLKPCGPEALAEAIREALAGRTNVPQATTESYEVAAALTEAGLAFPFFLTEEAFGQWDRAKVTPQYWLSLAGQADYQVSRLAAIYGWHSRYLNHEWHRVFLASAGRWLHCVRMAQAAYALWRNTPATEAAAELRYRQVKDFYRAFRRFFGMTTTEFVRRARNQGWEARSKCYLACSKCYLGPRGPGPPHGAGYAARGTWRSQKKSGHIAAALAAGAGEPKQANHPRLRYLADDAEVGTLVRGLSGRELGLLEALAGPSPYKEIADKSSVSYGALKARVSSLFAKCGVRSRPELIAKVFLRA